MSDITITEDNKYELFRANHYELYIRKLDEEEYNDNLRLNVAGIKATVECSLDSLVVKFYATLPVLKWINEDVKQNIFNKVKYDLRVKLFAPGGDSEYTLLNGEYYISSVSTELSDGNSKVLLFNVEFVKQSENLKLLLEGPSYSNRNKVATILNKVNYINEENMPTSTVMCEDGE